MEMVAGFDPEPIVSAETEGEALCPGVLLMEMILGVQRRTIVPAIHHPQVLLRTMVVP